MPVEELLEMANSQTGSSKDNPVADTSISNSRLSDEQIEKARQALPFDIVEQTIYYLGPTPAREGQVIGSAGPTTSTRMDRYTPILLDLGLAGMIGKGRRSAEVIAAMQRNTAVYFAATGGAGALLSKCIKSAEVIAYDDLGTEAIRKLYVENLPVIAVIDCNGNNQYDLTH
ncbi:MAG: fumarate hydratase C-terminal domain-containing protein [Eubacterium sp.]|nr:fumarate hydratase C-terminal domain-containing protein [Eubacterium sp.]